MQSDPSRIIVNNKAAISMVKYNKDNAGDIYATRIYHYVRQGTAFSGLKLSIN